MYVHVITAELSLISLILVCVRRQLWHQYLCTATAVLNELRVEISMNVHAVSPHTTVNKVHTMLFFSFVQGFHGKEPHICLRTRSLIPDSKEFLKLFLEDFHAAATQLAKITSLRLQGLSPAFCFHSQNLDIRRYISKRIWTHLGKFSS
jgi:hypothetical protein